MMLQMKFEIASYTADTFAPYAGQVLTFGPGDVQLELLQITRRNVGDVPAGFREPFSLLFVLRSGEPLARGLHRIAHPDFEPADWFITRVLAPGRDPRQAYYEAVFG
jgi:hypothetical protein